MFPKSLHSHIKSDAEKLLFQAFQEQLSGNFTVLHSVAWQVPHLLNGAKDGEADFIIACPDLGVLVVEVKGGKISYDGTADQWYSNIHSIKDPFRQACESMRSLVNLLKAKPYWKNRWIPMGYAVAFPDVKVKGGLPVHAPREILIDGSHIQNVSARVQTIFNYWRGQNSANSSFDISAVEQLVKVLRPSVVSSLLQPFVHDEKKFIELVDQQFNILDFLARHRQVAICGCAGSGKTLLAIEKAYRLHEQGFSVLLTCYNKALAKLLRQRLGHKPNLHVYTFHSLCEKLFRQAALELDKDSIPEDQLFKEEYPKLLVQAADLLNWRVDAIIVDEGQDFYEHWWLALKRLLKEPDDGIFYFFYDDNQNIFNGKKSGWLPPLKEAPFILTKNCRNTQKIHSYVCQFYAAPYSTIASGPLGKDVEIHYYTSDQELKTVLGDLLHRLILEEKVLPKDIVILTTRRKQVLQNKLLGQFLAKADPESNNEIRCNTIHYFKGLESPVVILVEIELNNVPNLKNLLYVGASRARHHLIIVRPNVPF